MPLALESSRSFSEHRQMSVDPVADIIGRRQPQDETSDVRMSILDVSVR
jgi:hypothetical protein